MDATQVEQVRSFNRAVTRRIGVLGDDYLGRGRPLAESRVLFEIGRAGADLRAREDVILKPGERKLVPTGVAIALPVGYVALIHPRSGLATKHGLTVVNAPGTVDAGYRGEIAVTLLNTDRSEAIELRRGDRIAQMVIQRVEHAEFVPVQELSDSVRGTGGSGSTGGFGATQA